MSGSNRSARGVAGSAFGILAAALAACLGGTGTDTENGAAPVHVSVQVVWTDSSPVAGARLAVYEAYSRADSVLENPVLEEDSADLLTDMGGFLTFRLKKNGTYVVQGNREDTIIFIDTLQAKISRQGALPGGVGNTRFHATAPVRVMGRMRLLSAQRPDSGRIVLQGTNLLWKLKADGDYDMGWLPPDAEKMTLRVVYWAAPTDSSAPAGCVRAGAEGKNPATLRIAAGEIVVDDLAREPGCPVDAQ